MSDSFPATRWSIVAAAGSGGESAVSRAALAELCQLYWYPLYSFARGTGLSPEDAEDRTQDFFAQVLETKLFAAADPSLGRLRSFLLCAFKHDLKDARRRASSIKRGGLLEKCSLADAEERFQAEMAVSQASAEELFDRRWALSVLDAAVERLKADFTTGGKAGLFESLRPFLDAGNDSAQAYEHLCRAENLTREAARQTVRRLRERFRAVLRSLVADTLLNPDADLIETELAALRAAVVGGC